MEREQIGGCLGLEAGCGEQLFNEHGVSFWGDENVLEPDRGGVSTTL